jgi:hypothetical protein
MTGLHALLEEAVESPAEADVTADLRRGHRALRRRRTRAAAGLSGVALLGLGAVPVAQHLHPSSAIQPVSEPSGPVHTDVFDAPPPPAGWVVADSGDNFLALAREGAPDPHPDVFAHKIAVLLHPAGQWMGFGSRISYEGRTFFDNERNEGYPILAVRLHDGRWLQLEYPEGAGLEKSEMLAYLDRVVVRSRAGARG